MKNIFLLPFVVMGVLFILVSTVFYPLISDYLINLQSELSWNTPDFWDITVVLKIVRVIFLIVGIFLTCFGIGLFWWKRN